MASCSEVFEICQGKYLASDLCFLNKITSSSMWPTIPGIVKTLSEDVRCIVGTWSTISFWQDDWLGYCLVDKLNLHMCHLLLDKVSDFLYEGVKHFSSRFLVRFPNLVWDILQVPILRGVWDEHFLTCLVHGQVLAVVAMLSLRPSFPKV